MPDAVARLRGRLKHGLAVQEILDRVARRGIVFYPYIVFQELTEAGFERAEIPELYRVRQLTEQDITQLAGLPGRPQTEAQIHNRFAHGHLGIAAFEQDDIVAYSWCDLRKIGSPGQHAALRELENDEAYLYDAYTIPRCRGRSLVPFLRSEIYTVMQAIGRHKLYSISLFFNRSARRFKAKLGARQIELRLSINLFQKFKRDLLLKSYPAGTPPAGAGFIARLRGRLRHGLAVQEALDRLARRGLAFYPYLVYREATEMPAAAFDGLATLELRRLTEQDIPQLTAIAPRPRSETVIRERLARGDVGIGAFDHGSIVSYCWCEFGKLRGFGRGNVVLELEADEASLADAYTVPAWRGRGVLLFMRREVYGTMRAMGKLRLYSVCMYFNRSIRRFKSKVGARELQLRLAVNLFDRYKRDLLLKRHAR